MVKIGLLGVGHLGKIHLKLLCQIPTIEVVGFYDPSAKARKRAEDTYGVKAFDSMEELIDAVDAVDIVTPTTTHFECAKQAIEKGKHIFIEKPLTHTLEEAQALKAMAEAKGIVAQVGHVERFNPAFLPLRNMKVKPGFIEGHRLAQWNPRGTDVSVVLDLMIHDIDLVLHLVGSPVKEVSASGVSVISHSADIANARITFANGCVANLTASRISMKNMRKLRLFQPSGYLSIDFLSKKTDHFLISDEKPEPAPGKLSYAFEKDDAQKFLTYESVAIEPVNSIKMELEEFAASIESGSPIQVSLEDGMRALETAYEILARIEESMQLMNPDD